MKKDEEIRKRVTYSTDFYPLLLSMDKVDVADVFLSLTAKYIKEPLQEFQSERAKVIFEVLCNDYDKAYEITHTAAQKRGQKGAEKRWHPKDKPKTKQQQQPELFKEEAASEEDNVPLVEAEEVEPYPFERFWNLYNFKHDKQPAEKAWNKLNNKDRAAAMAAIPNYHAYLEHKRSTGFNQNQAYAATYLNKRRWEDDYSITDTTPQNNGNNNKQYNNRLAQQQRNNEVLCNIMAEAAAAVQPYNPIETTGAGNL